MFHFLMGLITPLLLCGALYTPTPRGTKSIVFGLIAVASIVQILM